MQAKRVLKSLEESGALQAQILSKRIAFCGHAQVLADIVCNKTPVLNIDMIAWKEAVAALSEKEVTLPFEVVCLILEVEAVEQFQAVLQTTSDDLDTEAAAETFAQMIAPLSGDEAKTPEFDPFKPRANAIMAPLVDAMSSALVEIPQSCMLDGQLAEEPAGEGAEPEAECDAPSRSDMLENRWKATVWFWSWDS